MGKSKKKASTREALALFSVSFLTRESLPESGAKVKKEAENSSIHACITLNINGFINAI
jgi:biotin synthase-like enzyme